MSSPDVRQSPFGETDSFAASPKGHESSENPGNNADPSDTGSPSGDEAREERVSGKGWLKELEQTFQLGDQFISVIIGILGLARAEAELAVRTIPKLILVWVLMVPAILLTWCSFSVLAAWAITAASDEVGMGILMFFMLQLLLLLICRWLVVRYRKRMGLPYTRVQIDQIMRKYKP